MAPQSASPLRACGRLLRALGRRVRRTGRPTCRVIAAWKARRRESDRRRVACGTRRPRTRAEVQCRGDDARRVRSPRGWRDSNEVRPAGRRRQRAQSRRGESLRARRRARAARGSPRRARVGSLPPHARASLAASLYAPSAPAAPRGTWRARHSFARRARPASCAAPRSRAGGRSSGRAARQAARCSRHSSRVSVHAPSSPAPSSERCTHAVRRARVCAARRRLARGALLLLRRAWCPRMRRRPRRAVSTHAAAGRGPACRGRGLG
mmetsp:Transcript_51688/g.110428  ORF Transcript_51688/g.110428 Transcript_51688/m.110428 type:complete len:266 (+) Transcript_51688:266-1063(+)